MEVLRFTSAISLLLILQIVGSRANQTAFILDTKTSKRYEATGPSPVGLSTLHAGHNISDQGKTQLPDDGGSRIILGEPADEGEFPFMVSIQQRTSLGKTYCGGTLMTASLVLTACQCLSATSTAKRPKLRPPSELSVVAGVTDLTDKSTGRDAQKLQCHPRSVKTPTGWNWDFGMITVNRPFPIEEGFIETFDSERIQRHLDYLLYWNPECFGIGWGWYLPVGRAHPTILQKVKLNLLPQSACNEMYTPKREIGDSTFMFKGNLQTCTKGYSPHISTCDGDTGGPLLCTLAGRPSLIGVLTWRINCHVGQSFFIPGVWARLGIAEEWIKKVIASPVTTTWRPYPGYANHNTPGFLTGFSFFTVIKTVHSAL